MPTRREAVLAVGTAVAATGCSGILPETEPNVPTSADIDRSFEDAGVEVRDPELEIQGTIIAIGVAVTIVNTSRERRRVRVRAQLYDDAELYNGGSTTVTVPSNTEVTERIGAGKITFTSSSGAERLTRLIIAAKVGDFGSSFQTIAVYTGEDVRELAAG